MQPDAGDPEGPVRSEWGLRMTMVVAASAACGLGCPGGWLRLKESPASAGQGSSQRRRRSTTSSSRRRSSRSFSRSVPATRAAFRATRRTPLRLQPLATGSTTWTEEESRKNFEAVQRVAFAGNSKSRLLMHPLDGKGRRRLLSQRRQALDLAERSRVADAESVGDGR